MYSKIYMLDERNVYKYNSSYLFINRTAENEHHLLSVRLLEKRGVFFLAMPLLT